MCWSLRDHPIKIDCYIHRLLNIKLMVTTNQETMIDRHTHTKGNNPNITLNKVIRSQGKIRREEERGRKNYKSNQKTINKMAVSTHLSIITLNVNRKNAPIK